MTPDAVGEATGSYTLASRTVVQRGELKPGTYRNMLKQLDIPKEEF